MHACDACNVYMYVCMGVCACVGVRNVCNLCSSACMYVMYAMQCMYVCLVVCWFDCLSLCM